MSARWPIAWPGERIGLLGGSFNPAHGGHLHVSRVSLRRLRLDRVWWLVAPQNPLKPVKGMAPFQDRLKKARKVALDPRILVSDLERDLGTRYTKDTVAELQRRYPGVTFIWLMGGDNLATFHRWHGWQELARRVAIGIVARPGYAHALASPFARRFAFARARPLDKPPAWRYMLENLHPASATALRAAGLWRPEGKAPKISKTEKP